MWHDLFTADNLKRAFLGCLSTRTGNQLFRNFLVFGSPEDPDVAGLIS